MNNQQRELEASNQPNDELATLEEQLRESVAAEGFFNLASGKTWERIMAKDVEAILKDITSNKFLNDHQGYVHALGRLEQARRSLRLMQAGAAPARRQKIHEKINEIKGEEENA